MQDMFATLKKRIITEKRGKSNGERWNYTDTADIMDGVDTANAKPPSAKRTVSADGE